MLLIALAVQMNVTIDHMDVLMAFLHAYFSKTVYVRKPEGFEEKGKEDFVFLFVCCRIHCMASKRPQKRGTRK
jgi:hypothetical protein